LLAANCRADRIMAIFEEDIPMPDLTMLSPLPTYLDERIGGTGLAARTASLAGKRLGLLTNWRPSAVEILQGVGAALGKRFELDAVVMIQPMREVPISKGKVIEAMR
jgi:hypothetical protein